MKRRTVRVRGTELAVFDLGRDAATPAPLLVWAHGWGHTHRNLLPLAQAMGRSAHSMLLDFSGFGASPLPPTAWSTADYADAVGEWLAGVGVQPLVWIGHSFGARVGLQLAARRPELVDGLFLVAAAGLPKQRSLPQRARLATRRWAF